MLGTYYHPLVIARSEKFIRLWNHNFGLLYSTTTAKEATGRSNSVCGSPNNRVVSRTAGVNTRV